MTTPATPSVEQLRRAVELAEQIAGLQSELDSLLGRSSQGSRSSSAASTASAGAQQGGRRSAPRALRTGKASRKRTMSPEAREKIAAAQRARWAKQKKDSSK